MNSTVRVPRRKDLPTVHKGRTTVSREKETFLRTELLTREQAECLCAALVLSPYAVKPQIRRDHHAHGTPVRYYVRWKRNQETPLSGSQSDALTARLERAIHQFGEMWQPEMPDRPGWYWTIHQFPDSDAVTVYETRPGDSHGLGFECTCPDIDYREVVQVVGCKHIQRKRMELGLPELMRRRVQSQFDDTPEGKAARREWCKANAGRDFC